ncbi:MAG: hypothetical protein SNJ78_13095, partial [Spirochaetales bacterium]
TGWPLQWKNRDPLMTPLYSEQDLVLKHSEVEGLIQSAQTYGILNPEQRSLLVQLLEKARVTGSWQELPELNAHVGREHSKGEYVLVIHDVYDPRNLLTVLFDRLTTIENPDPALDKALACELVDAYLGVIEKREKVDLKEAKEKLKQLSYSLKDTLPLFQGEEFNETDYEKLSQALDRAYFEPISEILEGILVTIAGN